ncbi:MAG TPA: MFS transporter, partial [Thermodesulfobacteriota bacterium]|nr:MFS transporter [Thermodesulfobacteriota bacterium]
MDTPPHAPPGPRRPLSPGRALLVLYASTVAFTSASGAFLLLLPPYLEAHRYSLGAIGVLTSLVALLRLASRVPVGAAYRAARARWQYAGALLMLAAATGGFALAGGRPLAVALLTAAHGFAFGSVSTLALAIVIDLTRGERAGTVIGWYTAALSAGYSLGAFAGGALADAVGIPGALALLGGLPALAAAAV